MIRPLLLTFIFIVFSYSFVKSQCVDDLGSGCANGGYTWEYNINAGGSINFNTLTPAANWFYSTDMGATWLPLPTGTYSTPGVVWILGVDPAPGSFASFAACDWDYDDCVLGIFSVSGGSDCILDGCPGGCGVVPTPVCAITSITFAGASACNNNGTPANPSDDFFTANITVNYTTPPATGNLVLSGDGSATVAVGSIGATSYTFAGVTLPADGSPVSITATFSALAACTFTGAGPSVASCSAACPITFTSTESDITCNGDDDGSASVTVTSAGAVTYSWSHDAANVTNTATGLSPGTYTVTITESGGGPGTPTNFFSDDFEAGSGNWTLNGGVGTNIWTVNNVYTGATCNLFGAPLYTIPSTPNEPAGTTGGVNSNYLHVYASVEALGICDLPFNPNSSCFDGNATSTQYATLASPISTATCSGVSISFIWLCQGGAGSNGSLQYSYDGATWTTLNTYSGSSVWTTATVTNPALDNQANLYIRFVWTNGSSGSDPAFAIDEVSIDGTCGGGGGGAGCSVTQVFTITEPAALVADAGTWQSICTGSSTTLSPTSTGGTGTVTYSWLPAVGAGGVVSPATTTVYTLTATDASLCSDQDTVSVIVSSSVTPTITGINPTYCDTDAPIGAVLSPLGGTWSGPGTSGTNIFSPAIAGVGTHTLTYTFGAGACSGSATINVTVTACVCNLVINTPSPICSGSSVDLTAATITAGSDPGTLTYFTDAGCALTPLATPTAVGVGTYYILLTTATACTSCQPITISATPTTTVSISGLNPTYCLTDPVSFLLGTPLGGVFSGPVSPGDVFDPAVAGVGTHTITYTYNDVNGCPFTQSVTTTVSATNDASFTGYVADYCTSDPIITITPTTAGGTFTIDGVGSPLSFLPSSLSIGSHTLSYTVGAGTCADVQTATITVHALGGSSITGLPLTMCTTDAPVVLTTTPIGGVLSGTGIVGSTFDPSITGIGTFTINYTDPTPFCPVDANVSVTVTNCACILTVTDPAPTCVGTVDITLPAITAGSDPGTLAYFTDAGCAVSPLASPTAISTSGTYYIQLTTVAGCINCMPVNVSVGSTATGSITGLSATYCDTDPAVIPTLSPAGGTLTGPGVVGGSFDPTLAGVGTHTLTYSNPADPCFTAGTFTVTVTNCACILTITDPAPTCAGTVDITLPAITAGSDPGTLAYFTDAGCAISPLASPTAIGVSGIYYIQLTTAAGCINCMPVNVNIGGMVTGTITGLSATYCDTDPVVIPTLSPAGGTLSGPGVVGASFDPALAGIGTHTLTYSNPADPCFTTGTFTVTVNSCLCNLVISNPLAVCAGTPVDITLPAITAGSDPGTLAYFTDAGCATTPLATPTAITVGGTYYIQLTTAAGCQVCSPVVVTINPNPTPTIIGLAGVYCVGDPITILTLTPFGGTLAGPGVIAPDMFDPVAAGAGTHTLTYSYFEPITGCFGSATATTTVTALADASFTGLNPTYCSSNGPVVLLPAVAGGSFFLDGGLMMGTVFDPSTAGVGTHTISYSVGAGACANISFQSTDVIAAPTASIFGLPVSICESNAPVALALTPIGGMLTGSGAVGTSFDPALAGTGTHTLTYIYTDLASGCSDTATASVTVDADVNANFTGLNTGYCLSDAASLLIPSSLGGTFTGVGIVGNSFDPNIAGLGGPFAITYTVSNGACSDTYTANTSVFSNAVPVISGIDPLYCLENTAYPINVDIMGGTFTGPGIVGGTFNPALAGVGIHTITYSYSSGTCGNSSSVQIEVIPIPTASFLNDNIVCAGDTVEFIYTGSTSGIVSYDWDFGTGNVIGGDGGDGPYYVVWNDATSTNVSLTISTANGCTSSVTNGIVIADINAQSIIDTEVYYGDEISLNTIVYPPLLNTTFAWSPDTYLSCSDCQIPIATPLENMQYIFTATDSNGCVTIDTVNLYVNLDETVFIPSSFSPNNDGINDYFEVFSRSKRNVMMSIYNRWGEKVYEEDNVNARWDGRFLQKVCDPDVFQYVIIVELLDGRIRKFHGNLTVVR